MATLATARRGFMGLVPPGHLRLLQQRRDYRSCCHPHRLRKGLRFRVSKCRCVTECLAVVRCRTSSWERSIGRFSIPGARTSVREASSACSALIRRIALIRSVSRCARDVSVEGELVRNRQPAGAGNRLRRWPHAGDGLWHALG